MMPPSHRHRFPKSLIALAAGAALAPQGAWALDFSHAPPGTVVPYVAPNVILSLDDSTSMNANMYSATGQNLGWRTTVLKNAVIDVFSDTALLPDKKIRLAWQTMGNCTVVNKEKWAVRLDAAPAGNRNTMRVLEGTHRTNFLAYMNNYTACTNTPTHDMVQSADQYMRAPLNVNGPWADTPGTTLASAANDNKPLGCRRTYHILLTDGGWNGTERQTNPRNYDGTNKTFPDNTAYTATAQTRLYRDAENYTTIADWAFKSWADRLQNPDDLYGAVTTTPDYNNAPASETFTNRATNATATLNKYWNPRYNPATWPHMVTFTIGFSNDALPKKNYDSTGKDRGAITAPTSMLPYGYDGNLADYANGTYTWRAQGKDKGHDMWHAALNSRGQFYAVEKGEDLKKAFQEIVKQINTETEPDRGSTATSGSNATRNNVGRFTASYEPDKHWKGMVTGEMVTSSNATVPHPSWDGKSTADRLDATPHGSRVILSWSDQKDASGNEKGGVAFRWASNQNYLSTAQKAYFNAGSLGADRLNYIRGDTSKQRTSPADTNTARPFRQRTTVQGDIVNSEVWYTGAPASNYALKGYAKFTTDNQNRPPMIYVGGNDGMLHGFYAGNPSNTSDTDGGIERLAYVPRGVIPKLARLTEPAFNDQHRYYVDGSPMSGDVDVGGGSLDPSDSGYSTYTPSWRTMLVGTLGAGGKGYFVLDVTNPAGFADTSTTPQQLAVLDRTRDVDEGADDCTALTGTSKTACEKTNEENRDIGHIFAKPVIDPTNPQRTTQIVRMNNNRWAVVMGNGYNSANQRPVLLIQYLDQGRELVRLVATGSTATGANANTTDNGLAAPRLVDINNDGRPDVVYAGDNKGNLWKFLVASDNDSQWGVARWGTSANSTSNLSTSSTPLYIAKGGTEGSPNSRTLRQPIVTAPTVRANDRMKTVTESGTEKTVPVGGMMVAFGTGRNVARTDPENTGMGIHTLYSVLDNTIYKLTGTKKDRVAVCASTSDSECASLLDRYGLPASVPITASGPGDLVQRTISTSAVHSRGSRDFWTVDAATAIDWTTHKGWYLDLPETGERLLKPMEFYDSSNILAVFTQVPARGSRTVTASESCDAGTPESERQYLTLINIMDGKRPTVQLMDTNGNGTYDLSTDLGASRMSVSKGAQTLIKFRDKATLYGKDPAGERKDDLALMPETALRPSWRQPN